MILRKIPWLVFILLLIAASCAKQSTPTGGPKDTIPPVLESSNPKKNQINFKGKTIELEFSEMIMLNSPKEQIIIAPATTNPYEITNRNNRVIIKFENDLEDSSTYSINFRDAVKDVTEKNPAENLQLAFSTGSYIDSLSIAGNVYDLVKGSVPKEATVAIYPKNDTLSIFKHKPGFLTKTDKDGKFKLNNLKPGEYFLYALEDKNRNLIADSKSEFYGFISRPITLTRDTSKISIPIVKLDARTLKLTGARPYNNYFNLKTGKYLSNYEIRTSGGPDSVISSFGEDYANIRVYDTFDADSTLIALSATDSIGNTLDTSVYIKFNTRNTTPDKFAMNVGATTLLQDKGQLNISVTFNKPTYIANPDSLLFILDSANIVQLKNEKLSWNYKKNTLDISAKINPSFFKQEEKEGKAPKSNSRTPGTPQQSKNTIRNVFVIGAATFVSIDNDSSAHAEKPIPPVKSEELSILLLNIETSQSHFIAELLTTDLVVLRRNFNTKSITWDDLPAGDYRIRVIIDLNKNGKWDPGNFFKKEEPEPIIYYQNPKSTPVNTTHTKANWTVGPLLIKY